jgi:hypothetical protein
MSCVTAGFRESNILLLTFTFYGAKLLSKGMTMRFIRVAGLIRAILEMEWRIDHKTIAMQGSISSHPFSQPLKPSTPVFDIIYPNQEHQKFALYSNK